MEWGVGVAAITGVKVGDSLGVILVTGVSEMAALVEASVKATVGRIVSGAKVRAGVVSDTLVSGLAELTDAGKVELVAPQPVNRQTIKMSDVVTNFGFFRCCLIMSNSDKIKILSTRLTNNSGNCSC